MKEIDDELLEKIKEYYRKYKGFIYEKKELSRENRSLKSDFVDIHFEDEEKDEKKRIKKEITKYFNTLDEVASGAEPILEIRTLRKDHLDFDEDLYSELMEIYKRICENKEKSEEISENINTDIYMKLSFDMETAPKIVEGVFKTWYAMEDGKYPVTLEVADTYRKIIHKVGE